MRVALIGAGKFGSMFLSQVPHTPGLEVPVIIDLDPERAREACRTVGWDATPDRRTTFTDDGKRCDSGSIEVIVEATGNPAAGIAHARAAIAAASTSSWSMSRPTCWRARCSPSAQAGVVYSLAYGDQPALIAEMVDWARSPDSWWSPPARARNICRPITT